MSNSAKSHEALTCGHCGETRRLTIVGTVNDSAESQGVESGTLYHLLRCPNCAGLIVTRGAWHEMMEGPDDFTETVMLPEDRDRGARQLLAARSLDLNCMVLAVAQARDSASQDLPTKPRVGAVVASNGKLVASAYRGELKKGEHAEFTLLERKCGSDVLVGATVYTTLEPCTTRNSPKRPCVERLIERKIKRVVIGMLDPDERIRGRGMLALRKANIHVDLFPPDLMTELEELNRDFIADREGASTTSTAQQSSSSASADPAIDRVKREVANSAKYLHSVIRTLPDGSRESLQGADQKFRSVVLPMDDTLEQFRRATAAVGESVAELGISVTLSVGRLLRLAGEVQATPPQRGFEYQHVDWKDWKDCFEEACVGLIALSEI